MSRSVEDLLSLFAELGTVGRRAIRRGVSTTIESRAARQKQALESFDPSKWINRFNNTELVLREPDDFDTVIKAVEKVRDEWASENPFWIAEWYPLYEMIEHYRGIPFDQFALYLPGTEEEFIFSPIQRFWELAGLTIQDLVSADVHGRLAQVTAEEVILGFARIASLAEMLHTGETPDDRYTDHERELYLRSVLEGEQVRDWLFFAMTDFIDDLRGRYERSRRIMKLRVIYPTAADLEKYLLRVYKTYIQGFVPESVIMSRAIVERSAKRACEQGGYLFEGRKDPELKSMLVFLQKNNWLSLAEYRDADDVRHRGNKAVHEDPTMITDAFETIEKAVRTVELIERKRGRTAG
jgi:hypothetical protein